MSAQPSAPLSIREYFSAQRELYSPADAAVIGPELERLAADGATKAGQIVDAARPADAPLHPFFEWDDRRAAEGFRHLQAARMTRSIVVKTIRDGRPVEELAFRPAVVRVVRSEATAVPPGPTPASPTGDARSTGNFTIVETGRPKTVWARGAERRPSPRPGGPARTVVLTEEGARQARTLSPLEKSTADSVEGALDQRTVERPTRPFVPEPGHTVWRDSQDPTLPVLTSGLAVNPDKLADEDLIGRAMASLLGFEAKYGGQRRRPEFEAIFSPVFMAIEMARKRAGLEGEPTT